MPGIIYGEVAAWDGAAQGWLFLAPRPGWRLWIIDEATLVVLTASGWQETGGGSSNPVAGGLLGINTTADPTNRLAVKTEAALLSHDDVTPGSGDMRLTLNKQATANDTSLTLQTGYSTRAQMGLTGDDDFRIKVSPDGATYHDSLVIDRNSGRARFDAVMIGNPDRANLYSMTGQTIPSATVTRIDYPSVTYDTNGFHTSAQDSRLTTPEAGGYKLQSFVQINGANDTSYILLYHKDASGTEISGPYAANMVTGYNTIVTPIISAGAGDYFYVECFQNTGADRVLLNVDKRNYFSIERVF